MGPKDKYKFNNSSSPSTPQKINNSIAELRQRLSNMEEKVIALEKHNESLEKRVEELEASKAISENVTKQLANEVDRLDQYLRRSNVIVRNVFLPEKETHDQINKKLIKVIKEDLNLPDVVNEVDKLHRVGKIKHLNGKKTQDVIIKFKSHAARYSVYNERKKARNIKIAPNLNKRRGKLLYDAVQLSVNESKVNFVYADAHGDLKIRLHEPHNEKHVFSFNSLDELNNLLSDIAV